MYCVNCGVELHDQEEKCPLCGTPVYRPDSVPPPSAEKLYSDRIARSSIRVNRVKYTRTTGFVMIVLAALVAIVNLCVSGNLSWAKYALISIAELWLCMVVPVKFAKKMPVGRIALILALATCAYLLLLDWFIGFSMWSVYAVLGILLGWVCGGLPFTQQYYARRRISFHLSFCLVMTALVLVVIDLLTGKSGFSLYTSFGLACLWCYTLLPLLLRGRFKVYIVLVVDYLITLVTAWMFLDASGLGENAHNFTLTLVTLLFASGLLVVAISKLTKFSVFGIVGTSFAFTALFLICLNLLVNRCFFDRIALNLYSIVTAACLVPIAVFLIVLEYSPRLKEYLTKKLFI